MQYRYRSKKSKQSKKTSKRKTTSKTNKAPCEVCTTRKISKKSGLYKLSNGDTHLRTFLPPDATLRENPQKLKHKLEKVRLEGLKPNTTLFYFATNRKDFTKPIKQFANAYDRLQNSGVVRTDTKGNVKVRVGCPQIYLAEDGKVYSRHFHIIYWQENIKKWDSHIYTHQIFCAVEKAFVRKMINAKSGVVIIDALDESYYEKTHIPSAVNLPASHKWSLSEVMQRLPKGTNATTPIIIYCYSPECNAAEKLWMQFNHLGFYNTMHYAGGISDWNS
jgi:rhodanese-related sulfurtransferase